MNPSFEQLNFGWNAEPNAPEPTVRLDNRDVLLSFYVNPFQYPEFGEGEIGTIRFVDCQKVRLGPTNDEGWYMGQCRFSKFAPHWGEFYSVTGDEAILSAPDDWQVLRPLDVSDRHFLFYFRDNMFECVAPNWQFEPTADNALHRVLSGS